MPLYYKHIFISYFLIKNRIFYRKNLTRRQNHIKCISLNTCTFNLILVQSQILPNHYNNQYQPTKVLYVFQIILELNF